MTLLVSGLALWIAAHLFRRVMPRQREAMGKWGRPVVAVLIVISLVMIVFGYRQADETFLYVLPGWSWHLNNLLMLVAIFLMDVGRVRGVVRTWIRHPMLTGVLVWSVAHLLVNGDLPSLVLFGGMAVWAVLEIIVINHAEGVWQRPERGSWFGDGKILALSLVLYAVIVAIHGWLDHPVF
tara:strand:+ start:4580 stop:5122 length:543 start_codon:yes stop_codon:yes gene_type:complete